MNDKTYRWQVPLWSDGGQRALRLRHRWHACAVRVRLPVSGGAGGSGGLTFIAVNRRWSRKAGGRWEGRHGTKWASIAFQVPPWPPPGSSRFLQGLSNGCDPAKGLARDGTATRRTFRQHLSLVIISHQFLSPESRSMSFPGWNSEGSLHTNHVRENVVQF